LQAEKTIQTHIWPFTNTKHTFMEWQRTAWQPWLEWSICQYEH
jgi:hypothetical protein